MIPVQELIKLKDWARSKGISRKDWDAQWRNWLRGARVDVSNGSRNGAGQPTIRIVAESDEPDLSVYDAIDRKAK